MLLPRHRIDLRLQHAKRANHARARLARFDHVVHIPALRGDERVREAVAKLLGFLFPHRSLIVRRGAQRLELTPAALRLLEVLMRRSPGVVSRRDAEQAIWNDNPAESDAALRGYVHALRQAIDREFPAKLIHTIHGIGYRLALEDGL